MGNLLCMGLFLHFAVVPSPRFFDRADHGLTACMDVNMLDGYFLLALAAVFIQRVKQGRPATGQFVRLIEVLAASLEGLFANNCLTSTPMGKLRANS